MAGDNFDNDLPPWLMDDDQQPSGGEAGTSSGVTGQLPWRQAASTDEAGQVSDEFASLDWDASAADQGSSRPADPFKGMTGTLPWNAQASKDAPAQGDTFASWLDTSELAALQVEEPAAASNFDFEPSPPAISTPVDDELPAWLQDEEPAAASNFNFESSPPAASMPVDDELPTWLQDEEPAAASSISFESSPPATSTPVDDEFPTWLQDEEPAAASSISFESSPPAISTPVDDELPAWLQDEEPAVANSFNIESPPAATPMTLATDEELPPWLFDDEQSVADVDEGLPSWISQPQTGDLSEPAEIEQFSQAPAESGEMSYEAWARQNLPTDEQDDLNWMTDAPAADMTYEQWDQQQRALEEAANAEPEIPLPDDLPDLLGSIQAAGGAPPVSADYVPEWFMGVEELDASAAPDWLRDTDLLKGGSGPLKSVEAPAPPDFSAMMGSDVPLPDFSAVAGEPPAPAPSQIKRLGGSTPAVSLDDLLMEDEPAFAPRENPLPETSAEPSFDALFGAMEDELPQAEESAFAPPEIPLPETPAEPNFDAIFGPVDELPSTGELLGDSEPDWLQGYDQAGEMAQPEAHQPMRSVESETADLGTGALPDWFQDLNLAEMPTALPSDLEQPTFAPAAPGLPQQDEFDFESLFSSDFELPATTATPPAAMETSGSTDLGFDEDFLSGFAMSSAPSPAPETPYEADYELEEAESLEMADLEESGELPAWMQQVWASGDEYVLKLGGVEGRFAQVPPVVLPQDLRELREQIADYLAQATHRGRPIDEGILAGVEGALEVDLDLVTPGLPMLDKIYDVSDTQQLRLDALHRVLEIVRQETDAERIEIRFDLEKDEDAERS